MSDRPLLLDLFCGAGGAAVGYHRAGFDVIGVDLAPQPHYPFEFVRADAMTYPLDGFDAIHASPPCQAYSTATTDRSRHPDLYEAVRERLAAHGAPWVIENVIGAPYLSGVVLCGSMFGLRVRRHRNFESSTLLFPPSSCQHRQQGTPLGVFGDHPYPTEYLRPNGTRRGIKPATVEEAREVMEMPWSDWYGCTQAIPPSYTEWIGHQLRDAVAMRVSGGPSETL
jgi:DNA (cytosine-5)-methyltransferase 1